MSNARYRARYRRIVWFFARLLISLTFWDVLLPRLGFGGLAKRTRAERLRKAATAYRVLAVQLGGVLIKVGQFLSSRVDVLPPEFTRELEGLQDEVPAESFDDIRRVAETEFGVTLEEKFAVFETAPLAAASLGQAHRARLRQPLWRSNMSAALQGFDVVVKVQRPNIEKVIETDLAALQTVGKWLHRYPPIRRRANVPALLDEFTRILYEEIDYLNEGHNAETFAANFENVPGIRVPRVVWTHTTRRTLTLENVLAIKITDYPAIAEAGIRRADVAKRLLDVYMKQIFEDGFFHADPHPGNLFVHPLPNPTQEPGAAPRWELTFIDFGMTGQVPPNLMQGLREALIGVGTQDVSRVIKSYQMMDILLPGADLDLLEKASTAVFDRFWGKNMSELTSVSFDDVSDMVGEFRDLLYDMPFQMPQNIIFLGRTVGILSGMCTGLDPEFNVWDHVAPYARKLVAAEMPNGPAAWLDELGKLARMLAAAPRKIDSVLTRIERGELGVRAPEVSQQIQRLEGAVRQMTAGIVFAAFLLSGVQFYLAEQPYLAAPLGVGAVISLGWLLLNGHGRKRG